MKKTLLAIVLSLCVMFGFAQTNGDYRSSGNGNWNQVNTWEVFNGGWVSLNSLLAGPFRNIIPSNSSGNISILNNVFVTSNISINETTIFAGGYLWIQIGRTVVIVDDFAETPLRIESNGFLINSR